MKRYLFAAVCAAFIAGCGSNIPIDPTCESLFEDVVRYECTDDIAELICDDPEPVRECYRVKVRVVCDKTFRGDCKLRKTLKPIECPDVPVAAQLDDDDCGDDPLCPIERTV